MLVKKVLQQILRYQMRLQRRIQEKQRLKDKNTRLAKLLDIKRNA